MLCGNHRAFSRRHNVAVALIIMLPYYLHDLLCHDVYASTQAIDKDVKDIFGPAMEGEMDVTGHALWPAEVRHDARHCVGCIRWHLIHSLALLEVILAQWVAARASDIKVGFYGDEQPRDWSVESERHACDELLSDTPGQERV